MQKKYERAGKRSAAGGVGGPRPMTKQSVCGSSSDSENLLADAKLAYQSLHHVVLCHRPKEGEPMPKPQTNRIIQRVVRLSPEEDKAVKAAAEQAGFNTQASYLRSLALKRRQTQSVSRLDRDLQKQIWKQIAGMGRNLNQIAFKMNSDVFVYPDEIKRLESEINALRDDLKKLIESKPEDES